MFFSGAAQPKPVIPEFVEIFKKMFVVVSIVSYAIWYGSDSLISTGTNSSLRIFIFIFYVQGNCILEILHTDYGEYLVSFIPQLVQRSPV
jgi:hypothetical protein